MIRYGRLLLVFVLLLAACGNNSTTTPTPGAGEPTTATAGPQKFLNQIGLTTTGGLEIERAFITTKKGQLLNPQNKVQEGETIFLTLVTKNGWQDKNGMVSLGAMLTLTTGTGEPVLKTGDLFGGTAAITKKQSRSVQLKLTITRSRPDILRYHVRFSVWNKTGNSRADGFVTLSLAREV